MPNFRVGRVGQDIELDTISEVSFTGDEVSIEGRTWDITYAEAARFRGQIVAYMKNSDESFVPILSADMPEIDGMYRINSVSVVARDRRAHVGVFDFSLRAERVQGFAAPLFESVMLGAQRAGLTFAPALSAQAFHALPACVQGYETGVLTPTVTQRESETGTVSVFTDPSNHFFNARPQFFIPPASWYDGAATLTVDGSLVVGRQVSNSPQGFVLSNGLVRFVGVPGGWFRSERWNPATAQWDVSGGWWPIHRVILGSWVPLDAPHTLTVMRNTPQSVIVRLTCDAASAVEGARFAVTVDLELRRGAELASFTLTTRGSYAWGLRAPLAFGTLTSSAHYFESAGVMVAGTSVFGAEGDGSGVALITTHPSTSLSFGIGHSSDAGIAARQWAAVQAENVTVAAR